MLISFGYICFVFGLQHYYYNLTLLLTAAKSKLDS